jgi:hypothetical protein
VVAAAREPAVTALREVGDFSRNRGRAFALQTAVAMTFRLLRMAAPLVLAPCFLGCIESDRNRARDGSDVSDDFDQQQWATTSPNGDGSGESGAYFGSPGPTSEPVPARRAASPEAVPARTPASPRPGSD